MTIGERIAQCRKDKNFSQEYIAEMLDVSRQAVSKWENGLSDPDTGNLIRLAQLFGVSVEYLVNGEETSSKVVYVEKQLPIMKIMGILLIALGAISLVLGILLSWVLFSFALVFVLYGVLMLTLKKEGLFLASSILVLFALLFVAQGVVGGVDTPTIALLFTLSVGLSLLGYGIYKLVKRAKENGTSVFSKAKLKISKRWLIICIIALVIITAILVCAHLVIKRRQDALGRLTWFSHDTLESFSLEGLPKPDGASCININQESIYVDFTTESEGYHDYLRRVFAFLDEKDFTHLGTRGEVVETDGINTTYLFTPGYYLTDFYRNINDVVFVFGNSNPSISGDMGCHILTFHKVEPSTIFAGGEKYHYDTIISLYHSSSRENYSFPTYAITYEENGYFMGDNPTRAMAGVEVKIKTTPLIDADLVLLVNNIIAKQTHADGDFWEYTFTMPYEDVHITYLVLTGEEPPPADNTYLYDSEEWLQTITASDVTKIETVKQNRSLQAARFYQEAQCTTNPDVIAWMLEQYATLIITPVNASNVESEGANSYSIIFTLTDGTTRTLEFQGNFYHAQDTAYYRLETVPLLPANNSSVDYFFRLPLQNLNYTVYTKDGVACAVIYGLAQMEFTNNKNGDGLDTNSYTHYIETELGILYLYTDTVFCFQPSLYDPKYGFVLTSGTFEWQES